MKDSVNFQGKEDSRILRDGEHVFQLLEGVRSNLSKLFLETGNDRKLHKRYVQQRQKRAWDSAKKVDDILKKYPSSKQLTIIYYTILRNIQIAAGTKPEAINESSITSLAQSMATFPIDKERPNLSIVMTLLEKMGMTRTGVERFLSGSLGREVSNKMNQ